VIALKIKLGSCFNIFALEEDGKCELLDFLNFISTMPCGSLVRLVKDFDRTADVGLLRNRQRFRVLDGEIYEFRVPGEVRVLCFLDGKGIVVLTNGYNGQHSESGIDHAVKLRRRYFDAKVNGYLTYRDELL